MTVPYKEFPMVIFQIIEFKYTTLWHFLTLPERDLTSHLVKMFSLEKSRLQADLAGAFQYLKGACKGSTFGDYLSLHV